jgi:hypothetical protein
LPAVGTEDEVVVLPQVAELEPFAAFCAAL